MIIFDRKAVRIAEYWFDEPLQLVMVDVIRCMQRSTPITPKPCDDFYTVLLDLRQEADDLLAAMKKETRYEIRRAEARDGISCQVYESRDMGILQEFLDFYIKFARSKGIPIFRPRRLREYAVAGKLEISKTYTGDEQATIWHVYYTDGERARLLHSASNLYDGFDSAHRSLIGRTNRYHHWLDILRLKDAGISVYDFGGWYHGGHDKAKLTINSFKEGFGGQVVKNFNQEWAMTIRGKTYMWLRDLFNRLSSHGSAGAA